MNTNKKILVVGAGIAGPAVCYWLKKYGFKPHLIDRAPNLRTGGYAVDIRGIAVDVAQKMGIYQSICQVRTQNNRCTHVNQEGDTIHIEQGEATGFRQGDDVEAVRGDVINILFDAIADVPCEFNRTVQNIEHLEQGVQVTFNNKEKARFDLIVGADGLHSSTRGMVFDEQSYHLKNLGYYISIYSIPNYLNLNNESIMFEQDDKLAHVVNEKKQNTALAELMFRSSQSFNSFRDESLVKAFLNQTYQHMGWEVNKLLQLLDSADDLYFDAIAQVKMDSYTKDHVALLGDAGYCSSPLSGQGTSLALVGAYVLAGELKRSGDDLNQAFKNYNQMMKPFVDVNQQIGVWVSQYYLKSEQVDKNFVEKRTIEIMNKLQIAANAIDLPDYG